MHKIQRLLLSLYFILITSFYSFAQNEHFTQLSTENGLSINTIKHITQDYLGFMWIATRDGICKYDGSQIKIYKNTKEHLFSVGDNDISFVFEDSNNNLWLCSTHGGIAKYDRNADQFINYNRSNETKIKNLHVSSIVEITGKNLVIGTQSGLCYFDLTEEKFYTNTKSANFQHENITSLYVSERNLLWIGTLDKGIEAFNPISGAAKIYSTASKAPFKLKGSSIKTIIEDHNKNIWVGTWENGLHKISNNGIKTYLHDEHDISTISQNAIFDLAISSDGTLWVATEDKGLNSFNPTDESFHHIKHTETNNRSLADNSLQCLFIDSHENLWTGTFSHGVSILPKYPSPFQHIKSVAGNENSLSNNNIISVLKDSKGRLWIGTDGGGLNLYNEETRIFTIFKHNEDDPSSIGADAILEVYEDNRGTIWIGTYRGGLARFNEKTKDFTSFKHSTYDKKSISNNIVSYMFEDSEGKFWVSTWRNGFNQFHKETGTFTQYPFGRAHKDGIPSIQVNHMVEGKANDLWLATENGLVNFNKNTNKFTQYKTDLNSNNSISDEAVSSLYLDDYHNLWIGTRGGGLNQFNTETHDFTNYKGKGFSSEIIYHIIAETNTKLWISTNNGISKFNTKTKKIKNHGYSEGVLGTQFVTGSGFIDKNGVIYLGSTEGLNFFDPNKIFLNKQSSELNFTGFKIFNKEIDYENDKINSKHISLADKITLDYKQSVFTISFSYLNYIYPDKTTYEYQLAGFDKEWVQAGNQNFATYTNLDPDNYTFKVRATNEADNTEAQGISINIEIIPPFYMTLTFKMLLILFSIGIIYGLFSFRLRTVNDKRKHFQNINLALEKEIQQRIKTESLYKREKEKAEKAVVVKDDFLSNMSHEIRTPLNMILGYLQLIESNKTNIDQFLNVMRVSADNLLHLVNQILDLSKIEKGKLELRSTVFNINEYITDVQSLFYDAFHNKGIKFKVQLEKNLPNVLIGDKQRLNQILTNLLGNALKFTETGEVTLKISLADKKENQIHINFIVEDSGIGISEESLQTIFEKFTQEESDISRKFGGTGLGLTIAKELVHLFNGEISVESIQGTGSRFIIKLPFEITENQKEIANQITEIKTNIAGLKVLIVDDNQFNLTLSSTIIKANQAFPLTAISGEQALDLLDNNEFDVILMDIHMPEMNGYQVTKEIIKRNINVPIIGCTADVFDETFDKCIASGMLDVITKPFQINTLIEKINLHTSKRQKTSR